jgi:hypothetical protein
MKSAGIQRTPNASRVRLRLRASLRLCLAGTPCPIKTALVMFLLTNLGAFTISCAADQEGLWPRYRRDAGLTGFSPLKGNLSESPKLLWSIDLGGPLKTAEHVRLEDVNGDGQDELLRILQDRLICQDVRGRKLWETDGLNDPVVREIRDFAGNGTRGLLLTSDTGTERQIYMVSGKTGKKALLYTTQNQFGGGERIGHIIPEVKGEQICAWWSGSAPGGGHQGADQVGKGYLWSFEKGVENPVLRFQAEEFGVIYAPIHLIADMDGDNRPEMVIIGHEQVWIFDLETSKKKAFYSWQPQIRSYMAQAAAVSLKPGELPSLLMINRSIPGIEVISQDGKTGTRKWKAVVGKNEDQYQALVDIQGGAPDPFLDLNGDGKTEILAAVLNEHGDNLTHLVIFSADDGKRLFDQADLSVLATDDLDADGIPEVVMTTKNGDLRIANWNGHEFSERWRGTNVTALIVPAPPEGDLTRSMGGSRTTGKNTPLWREKTNSSAFLLRFTSGSTSEVWSSELKKGGTLTKLHKVEKHEALGNLTAPLSKDYTWDGQRLTVQSNSQAIVSYEKPTKRTYMPPPALVGNLGGQTRVIALDSIGTLFSYSKDGSDGKKLLAGVCTSPRVYVPRGPNGLTTTICDLDGDESNEVLALATDSKGTTTVTGVDAEGRVKLRIDPPEGTYETELGAVGSLGKGKGSWVAVRYRRKFDSEMVVTYEGKTGKEMWRRDYYGPKKEPATKFVLHIPTATIDVDGDGADDLLADSENHYGIISVKDNRDITPAMTITATVPGHWGAYATPIATKVNKKGPMRVFFSHAFGLTLLTTLEGKAVWHYGLTRDTTHSSQPGIGDLDSDGKMEFITAQRDGKLICYGAESVAQKCPMCPPNEVLRDSNHSGEVRWTFSLKAPVSDFITADLDGDGRDEALCGAGDGRLYALKHEKGKCAILWSVDLSRTVGSPILADLNGDGKAKIIVPTEDGKLNCLAR